jgi:hypothetical protein
MKRKDGKPKQKTYLNCDKCNDSIRSFAYNRHYKVCEGINKNLRNKKSLLIDNINVEKINSDLYICKICNKEYPKDGIGSHYWRNHSEDGKTFNPNKYYVKGNKVAWNKGLTKNTDKRIEKSGLEISKALKGKKTNLSHTDEFKANQSKLAKERGLGGVRQSKKIKYNGVYLGSTYELKVAQSLDENGIKWIVPKKINYVDPNGKERTYSADFYLEEYNIYLDPKNDFLINNINPRLGFSDVEKIKLVENQNNIKVIILNNTQLSWDNIKNIISNI